MIFNRETIIMTHLNEIIKVTLDHNCLIHLEQNTEIGAHLNSLFNHKNFKFYVTNVGASETCINSEIASNYLAFDVYLQRINLAHLPRLDPMFIWDFSYWDHSIFVDEQSAKLSENISNILFSKGLKDILNGIYEKKWRNKLCDIQTLWCHIYYRNDILLTTDRNFIKTSKINKLKSIGAGRICHPFNI